MSDPGERQLHLNVNVFLQGFAQAAWRAPELDPKGTLTLEHYLTCARIAERGKFDALFLADSNATSSLASGPATALEPTVVLAALAQHTSHLGLIATASTSFNEPYNIARRFASLDLISGGRIGFNAVTTADQSSAEKFGLRDALEHAARYRRADEFLQIAKALWTSWEDGALLADQHSGRFVDASKLHPLHYRGEFFTVDGVLNQPRSAQGHPVIVQAGGSADGQRLAARHAEAVFSASASLSEAIDYAQGLRRAAASAGRGQSALKVFPGLGFFLGGTEQEAQQRQRELIGLTPLEHNLQRLAGRLGVTPEQLALDKPLPPDLPLPNGGRGGHTFFRVIQARFKETGFTVRQYLEHFGGGGGHREFVGTPEQLADDIAQWFTAGAADGFNLMPDLTPHGLETFVEQVVPLLQRRGLFRTDYRGSTLRDHLGLPFPTAYQSAS
ncbi:LLM class flavin-dependent oxidoreductase [Carnimonas bestiolae]|uniref:LLM class flavin-dependent oxidoreductase n=1 Tax=Carnimonas bestiolae TaxID=3402172 RepID=UPI003EDCADA4